MPAPVNVLEGMPITVEFIIEDVPDKPGEVCPKLVTVRYPVGYDRNGTLLCFEVMFFSPLNPMSMWICHVRYDDWIEGFSTSKDVEEKLMKSYGVKLWKTENKK